MKLLSLVRRHVGALGAASTLVVAACGGAGVTAPPPSQPPTQPPAPPPAPAGIGSAGGTFTSTGLSLVIPAGALTSATVFVAGAATGVPSDARLIGSSAVTIGPAGTTFSVPATLTLSYADASLPADAAEVQLLLGQVVSGAWRVIDSATVDGSANTVRVRVNGTGTFGLLVAPITGRIQVRATSYDNLKAIGLTQSAFDPGVLYNTPGCCGTGALARTQHDFFQDSTAAFFTAALRYGPQQTPEESTPSDYDFWRRQPNGSYVRDNSILLSGGPARCIHPRKAIVADFNQDTRPDIFLICHGYDYNNTFPGEENQILLSQPDGRYAIRLASADIGFWHGGAAFDVNGDRYPDVIAANNFLAGGYAVFLNNRDGTFTREAPGRLPFTGQRQFFTLEGTDVDADGDVDVLVGGHEWEPTDSPSRNFLLLNPGNGQFASAQQMTLPTVPNEGVVLDFTVTGSGATRAIWTLRTSGGDGTFYQSRTVQRVAYPAMTSQVVELSRPAQWVPWLLPYQRGGVPYVGSDLLQDQLELPAN